MIQAALEKVERTVEASGDTAPLTRAMLEIIGAEQSRSASLEHLGKLAAGIVRRAEEARREAVIANLDWFEDAVREARRRTHRLALLAQAPLIGPPPR